MEGKAISHPSLADLRRAERRGRMDRGNVKKSHAKEQSNIYKLDAKIDMKWCSHSSQTEYPVRNNVGQYLIFSISIGLLCEKWTMTLLVNIKYLYNNINNKVKLYFDCPL